MDRIDISVIIPIYNVEDYLKECLSSVDRLSKMLKCEVLLVDDGSTDKSAEIAKAFCEKNDSFQYIYKEHSGVSAARNHGIKAAAGEYIAFVDADDVIVPSVYKEMLDIGRKQDSDLVKCYYTRTKNGGIKQSILAARGHTEICTPITHIKESPCLVYDTISCDKLVRKSLMVDHDIWFREDIAYNEDEPVNARLHRYANHCSICFKTGYLWRIRTGDSRSATQKQEKFSTLKDKIDMMKDTILFHREASSGEAVVNKLIWKSIAVQIIPFLDKLDGLSEDEATERIEYISSFIDEFCDENVKKNLPAIFCRIIEDLHNKDRDHLIKLANFASESYKNVPLKYHDDGRITLRLPESLFDNQVFDASHEFDETIPSILVEDCRQEGESLIIKGFLAIPRVQTTEEYPQLVGARLVDSLNNNILELDAESVESHYVTEQYGTVICHEDYAAYKYNHDLGGFSIRIDLNKVDSMDGSQGDLAVLLYHKNVLSEGWMSVRALTKEAKKQLKGFKYNGDIFEITLFTDHAGLLFVRRTEIAKPAEPSAESLQKDENKELKVTEKKPSIMRLLSNLKRK